MCGFLRRIPVHRECSPKNLFRRSKSAKQETKNEQAKMGIEFRRSNYKKDVTLGKRTIKDGEAVAIWNRLGVHRQVVGPRLTRLFFSTILFLDKRIAGPNEYLIVTHVDGTVNHIRGPITLYENPVLHISVEVRSAYSLTSASECLVVSREIRVNVESEKAQLMVDSRIERVLIRGPYLYYPLVGDTVVSFDWHGTPSNSSTSNYFVVPSAHRFTILNTAPRQWKVDLSFLPPASTSASHRQMKSFETKPGILQLSFNFHIQDVNLMLDNTEDVIGDLYDSLVIDLTNIQTTHQINPTSSLEVEDQSLSSWMMKTFSSIQSFPHLLSRSQIMGVVVEGVSYRGYEQNQETKKQLSELKEIEMRLSRDRMIAEQEQLKIESDLMARRARLEQEKNLQQATLAVKKETLQAEQDYREAELKHKLEQDQIQLESDLARNRAMNDETLRVLGEMGKIGVDLTKLLCQYTPPEDKGGSFPMTFTGEALVSKTPAFTLFGSGASNPATGTELKAVEASRMEKDRRPPAK
jgi:hypothetical protein